MFFSFDLDNFPVVYVIFNQESINEKDLDQFFLSWLQLYLHQNDFYFIFDTRLMKNIPSIKYAIKMTLFMKKLKKEQHKHYLKKSLILIHNKKIQRLLDFIFSIQSPIAPVLIFRTNEHNIKYFNYLILNSNYDSLPNDINVIQPKHS